MGQRCPVTGIACSCRDRCEEQEKIDRQRAITSRKERVLWLALVDAEIHQSVECQRAVRARMGGMPLMEGHEDDLLLAMNASNEIRRRLVKEFGLDLDELGYDAKDLYDEAFKQVADSRLQELEDRKKVRAAIEHGEALLAEARAVIEDSRPPRCFACGHEICACK